MSKERIENLKSTIKLIKDNVDANTHHFETLALATEIIINHGDWLIEQAERVQEWRDIAKWQNDEKLKMEKECLYLQKQNKRYREALEEIMKIQENHEWNLYGLAYGITERTLFELEGEE